MKFRFFCSFLLIALALHARKAPIHHFIEVPPGIEVQAPWFTGPLLAPSSLITPGGHFNIEPYVFAMAVRGKYNSNWKAIKQETFWNNYLQPSVTVGLTNWMDCFFNPTLFYNYTQGAAKWVYGDMPVGVDFQLWKMGEKVTDWISALKFTLRENIPIGRYQNLNPKKLGTDVGGGGSWVTAAGLAWGNLFYLGNHRFLSTRLGAQYTLPAPVSVKNLNAYGGAEGTRGTVYPAQIFQTVFGMELTLTRNWVLACDVVAAWTGRTRFKGNATAPNTAPPAAQFSMAPALEYNWNNNIGLIFGSWFTLAGRNSNQFAGGIIAFNYYQ